MPKEKTINKDVFSSIKELSQSQLDAIISPLAYLDADFNFVRVNRAYAQADNRTPDFFPGKNHFDLYPNKDNEKLFQRVIDSGVPYKTHIKPFEYADHPERGASYWDWELHPIKNQEGDIAGVVLSLIDVSERVRAQEALSHNLLDQEIVASILRLSLQPLPFKEILRQSLVLALQREGLGLDPKGVIFLRDPDKDDLVMTVMHGLPDAIQSSCKRIGRGECICGIAFDKEQMVFTDCIDHDHTISYPEITPHGHYCVPIKAKDELLGILNLYVPHGHLRTRVEEQFVNAVADALAGVILRERMTVALIDSERRFRSITHTAQDAIVTIDTAGNMISWNQGAENIFGYSSEEAIGKPLGMIMPERYRAMHKASVDRWSQVGSSHLTGESMEVTGLRKNGMEVPLEVTLSIWNTDDRYHVTGFMRDITERKSTEQRLRQASIVFENAAEGIVVTDKDGSIIAVNKAFTEISGYTENDVLGNNPRMWKSDHHDISFYQEIWASLDNTGAWRGEIWNRRKNGNVFPSWQSINAIKDDDGNVTNYISIFADISAIKESQERMEFLAHHDMLTGLPNRLLFNARLDHALERAKRENRLVGVMFLDLDNFKPINDGLGHPAGDKVLQQVSERLISQVRENDTVARIAGDEFIVTLEEVSDVQNVSFVAEKILKAFEEPFHVDGHVLHVTMTAGISVYPNDGMDVDTLVKNADAAMYRAKSRGKNRYCYYTMDLTDAALDRLQLENDLRMALKRNELRVYYQPQYSISTSKLTGAEALVRWQHPERGLLPPNEFIPLAESTGLIIPLGEWVLHEACLQAKKWHQNGYNISIAVNVAGPQMQHSDFYKTVQSILGETKLSASSLELEVTENFIMQKSDKAIDMLERIRDLGVEIAIDDFGTGYSSLNYLKRLPINKLKIDRSFIVDIPQEKDDQAIVNAIIALGKSLNLKIIAEGVEAKEQLAFLGSRECDEVQGYLYSPPVPESEFVKILSTSK